MAAICSLVSTVLGHLGELFADSLDGLLDAALERHRVRAGGDVAQALAHQRLGQHGRGRRAVTGDVVGLLRDLLDQLGADLLVRVLELDLLGDGDAVVGDRGGAPLLLQHDVAARGPRVTLTASASWFMPRSRPRRASSSNAMIFAMRFRSSRSGWMRIRWCPRRTVGAAGDVAGRHRPHLAGSGRSVTLVVRVLTPMISTRPLSSASGRTVRRAPWPDRSLGTPADRPLHASGRDLGTALADLGTQLGQEMPIRCAPSRHTCPSRPRCVPASDHGRP